MYWSGALVHAQSAVLPVRQSARVIELLLVPVIDVACIRIVSTGQKCPIGDHFRRGDRDA